MDLSIWAASWQNQQNRMCAQRRLSSAAGHLPSLIRVFAVCMKKAWVRSYLLSTQWKLWSDWADAQADLSLHWVHRPFCRFCHKAAHFSRTEVYTGVWVHLFQYFVAVDAIGFLPLLFLVWWLGGLCLSGSLMCESIVNLSLSDDYSFQMLNPGMFSITLQPEELVEGELIFMPTEVCDIPYYFLIMRCIGVEWIIMLVTWCK